MRRSLVLAAATALILLGLQAAIPHRGAAAPALALGMSGHVAFSPDGTLLATAGSGSETGGRIRNGRPTSGIRFHTPSYGKTAGCAIWARLAGRAASLSQSTTAVRSSDGPKRRQATVTPSSDPGWKLTSLGEGWWPNGINERGQVVGQSQVVDEGAVLWREGRQSVLRDPADIWGSYATAINDGGDIVGGAGDMNQSYVILWRKGVPARVPMLSEALDINNRGQIVGRNDGGAYVWEKGKTRRLPGVACRALAINDRGVVVGACGGSQAVLWRQGTMRKLVGSSSEAVDVNNRGQVVGWRKTVGDSQRHGFLWQNGRVTDLGVGVLPNAINDRGQIVGSCGLRACVWQNGRIMRIECPDCDGPGRRFSEATAINERQQIVGHYSDSCASCNTIEWPYLWTRRG